MALGAIAATLGLPCVFLPSARSLLLFFPHSGSNTTPAQFSCGPTRSGILSQCLLCLSVCCHHVRQGCLVCSCQGVIPAFNCQLGHLYVGRSPISSLFCLCSLSLPLHFHAGGLPTGKPQLLQGRLGGRGPPCRSAGALLHLPLPGKCPCWEGAGIALSRRPARTLHYYSSAGGAPLPFPCSAFLLGPGPGPPHSPSATGVRPPLFQQRGGVPLPFPHSAYLLGPGPGPLHSPLPPRAEPPTSPGRHTALGLSAGHGLSRVGPAVPPTHEEQIPPYRYLAARSRHRPQVRPAAHSSLRARAPWCPHFRLRVQRRPQVLRRRSACVLQISGMDPHAFPLGSAPQAPTYGADGPMV
ncbi:hypothetical protein NDU88_001100 [Pleurodeles waltl]|uniref:Uncharacterized protein n=1 Tax=Pleurodeles waltl TaxID=8319 RepID=A0AAV7U9F7_PLEWA|nr:hypothetical protein NDU88_001100 [Pleurodeles waltl]